MIFARERSVARQCEYRHIRLDLTDRIEDLLIVDARHRRIHEYEIEVVELHLLDALLRSLRIRYEYSCRLKKALDDLQFLRIVLDYQDICIRRDKLRNILTFG